MTAETEDEDEEESWGGSDDDEEEDSDMEFYVLQEGTGYMAPTLTFLAILHTVISLLCVVGYYCLKVPYFFSYNTTSCPKRKYK